MIKRIVVLLFFWAIVFGCTAVLPQKNVRMQERAIEKDLEAGPKRQEPMVIPSSIFHADPTLGKIKNNSPDVWVRIWINPKVRNVNIDQYDQLSAVLGEPTLILIPGVSRELHMDLGIHLVYAEGMIKTRYGWKSIGFATKDVPVDSKILGGGHYGWYVSFSQGDFQR